MEYQVKNGTSYSSKASDKIIAAIEQARLNSSRVRVWYGDNVTGASWNEEYGVTGTISRSTGLHKIPLLIANARSIGGGAILTHCIVHMVDTKTKQVLYSHELFKMPIAEIVDCKFFDTCPNNPKNLTHSVMLNGKVTANFESYEQASRYADFMTGKRMNK